MTFINFLTTKLSDICLFFQIFDNEIRRIPVAGNVPSRLFYSRTGRVRITFRSDASINEKGFSITYKAGLFFMIIPKLLPNDKHFFMVLAFWLTALIIYFFW